ncbi:hypothetical protein [Streptomyces iconiensis]|uniref:Uncharacterized protein n=1 Tax=Streptomyces iconiensis TaxID=1384038 RepID=A0ABT6ZQL5_9ACTN|nr:hypothetical protein [Streptomyces iconiensis]MDJ1130976.1 hypothetical protein [Streptomyces iconiensis]
MREMITQVLTRSKVRTRAFRAGARYFHHVENGLTGVSGPGVPEDNETGVIGWGTSWRMQGYVLMGERTGDPAYAVRLAELIEGVLAARDEERGITDHRGRSGPVWSTAGKFTAATAVVEDEEGRAALEVTVCPPRSVHAVVGVVPEKDGRFGLTVTGKGRPSFAAHGLSLDPRDPRRADHLLYEAYEQRSGITARLVPLPGAGDGGGGAGASGRGARGDRGGERRRVRAGQYAVRPARVALAAQTGMITYPIAGLARLAREREDAVPASVRARLEGWLDLVRRAVGAHEEQWQPVEGGRGCYRWLRDEPVSFAGAELPTNEFLAVGRTLVQLAAVTGEEAYAERAAAMARALRDDFVVRTGVAVWPYWPRFGRVYNGWSATGSVATDGSLHRPSYGAVTVPEDVTHALIDLDFLQLYHRTPGLPLVFTDADMRAVAAAFSRHVVAREGRSWRMRHDVGGDGRPGTDREQAHVAAWLPLGGWAAQLPELVRTIQPAVPPAPFMGVDTYCGALLARWG